MWPPIHPTYVAPHSSYLCGPPFILPMWPPIHPTYVAPTIPVALPPNLDITSDEVILFLCKIKPHSASGPDAISAWMLTTFAEEAAPSIASLFNLFLSLGKLPNDWKCSNVVPTPKETSKSDVWFYRPISLLPIISKTT